MRVDSSINEEPFAVLCLIRDAMGRNVRRCGAAADTPYTGVRDQITNWYFSRHCALHREFCQWMALAKLLDDKPDFAQFYQVTWPYRPAGEVVNNVFRAHLEQALHTPGV